MNTIPTIPDFNEAYNYFLLKQEDELLKAQARFEESILASTYAEEDAEYEKEMAELEKAYLPLYEAEEQAMAQDRANKTKHRKHRKSERDEFRHHRKPVHKWNREACNEFALNRKREKRKLKVSNLLSQYETEEQAEKDWAEKQEEKEYQYMFNDDGDSEYSPAYTWEVVSRSAEGFGFPRSFSYSCPEDFDKKYKDFEENFFEEESDFEEEEPEEEVAEEEQEDLFKELETPECDCNSYESAETEEELATKAAYNRGYITGYFTGREEGKKHVLDLLKKGGICVDLKALEETLFSKML